MTRRKTLSARSVSHLSDVNLWSFLVDFAMENDGQWPMKVDDLPWIYLLFPWKPWIYHGFTYYSHGNHGKVVIYWRLLIISRWIIRSCGDLGRCGTWEGEDLAMFTAFSRHYSSLVWEQPCIMLFAQLIYHISYIYICIYIDMFIWIYTCNIHTVHMSIHTYIHWLGFGQIHWPSSQQTLYSDEISCPKVMPCQT